MSDTGALLTHSSMVQKYPVSGSKWVKSNQLARKMK